MTDTVDIVDCMTAMRGDHQPFAVATVVRTEDATAAKAGARAVGEAPATRSAGLGSTGSTNSSMTPSLAQLFT